MTDTITIHEPILMDARNVLVYVLPKYSDLAEAIRVIDVPKAMNGLIVSILMDADMQRAVGFLKEPG